MSPFCAPDRARTCNLRIRSPTLYPIELQAPSEVFPLMKKSSMVLDLGWKKGLEPSTTRSTIWRSAIELLPPRMSIDRFNMP